MQETTNRNDGRKMLRVAIMLTILDNVRSRIQRYQFKPKRTEADVRTQMLFMIIMENNNITEKMKKKSSGKH